MTPSPLLGAVVVLAVTAEQEGCAGDLDECLTTLVAAADEAAASGTPVVLSAALHVPGGRCARLLERWRDLARALDAVSVVDVAVTGTGARRRAARTGLEHPAVRALDPRRVGVLTTDTTTAVGVDWVLAHGRHLASGFAASTAAVLPPRAATARDGHDGHDLGANMAVRADAYAAADGFPALDAGEAVALWEALRAAGHRLCHAVEPRVTRRGAGTTAPAGATPRPRRAPEGRA